MSKKSFTFGAALGAAFGWAVRRYLAYDYKPVVIPTLGPPGPSEAEIAEAFAHNEWLHKALTRTSVYYEEDPMLVKWLSGYTEDGENYLRSRHSLYQKPTMAADRVMSKMLPLPEVVTEDMALLSEETDGARQAKIAVEKVTGKPLHEFLEEEDGK